MKYLHDLKGWSVSTKRRTNHRRKKLSDIELDDSVSQPRRISRLRPIVEDVKESRSCGDNIPFGLRAAGEFGTYLLASSRSAAHYRADLRDMFRWPAAGNYVACSTSAVPSLNLFFFFVAIGTFLANVTARTTCGGGAFRRS